MQAQWKFEQQLNPDERARLISLKPRFAIAEPDCPLPTSARQPFYLKLSGPLSREFADTLSEAGLSFIGYAYPHAHMVRAKDAAALQRVAGILRNSPEVKGTLLRLPMDACSERAWGMYGNPDVNGAPFRVLFWRDVSVPQAEALLAANHAPVVEATRGDDGHLDFETPFVDTWLTRDALTAFVNSELVEWVEPTPVLHEHNVDSVALSNALPSQIGPATSYNLDGTGIVVGVWDAARARDTHVDFQGAPSPSPINNGTKRVLKVDGTSLYDHSCHVTGTIIGDGTGDASAKGYAPKACALSYSWNSMDSERRTARHDYRHAADNHSYGTSTPSTYNSSYYGGYDSGAQSSDIDIRDIWLNMCKSAGNDGDISGSSGPGDSTCSDDSCMKNSCTIAAVSDTGGIASFSSRGPTNDGRLIPHFSANGVNLRSTGNTSDTAYLGASGWSGTSMASPSACGSIVLLTQLWYREMNNRQFAPDVVRAILADTADDRGNQGPDYRYGFGIVDCQRAADLILANSNGGGNHIIRGTVRQNDVLEYNLSVTSSSTPLKVVCSWLDIYASTGSGNKLVNDIDLVLVDPSNGLHYPWSGLTSGGAGGQTYQFTRTGANRRDNIELAEVDNPAVGTWKVRVTGFSIPANPQNTVLNDATGFVIVSENAMSTSQETFEDNLNSGSPVSIPDNNTTGITRTFNVSNTDAVKNVRVFTNIRHTRRGDIDIYLTHGSTTAHIETSDTSSRDDIIGIYPDTRQYDDDTDGFIGASAAGTWTVRITDTASGNTGTLDWLAIQIDYDTVNPPINQPPTANAGSSQTVNEGTTVNLNGGGSSDPDSDPLTYQWVRTSGPAITLLNSNTATPSSPRIQKSPSSTSTSAN